MKRITNNFYLYTSGFWILIVLSLFLPTFGQMSRKPSPTNEPEGVMDKKPDSKKNSLLQISTREDFDSIARVYHQEFACPGSCRSIAAIQAAELAPGAGRNRE